jgi:hypothetical protein
MVENFWENVCKETFQHNKNCKRKSKEAINSGSEEHGNKTFKQKLFQWMEENKSESWAEVGAYIINAWINQQPSCSKDN